MCVCMYGRVFSGGGCGGGKRNEGRLVYYLCRYNFTSGFLHSFEIRLEKLVFEVLFLLKARVRGAAGLFYFFLYINHIFSLPFLASLRPERCMFLTV